MAKILLIIAVFAAVYFVVRAYARAMTRGQVEEPRIKGDEDMVRCRHCGVHLPRSESLGTGDALFCSEEHRRLHGS